MNLHQNTALIQAVRDEYDLTIPQAQMMLIAHQFGTVSTDSGKLALDMPDAKKFAGSRALAEPDRRGYLVKVGKTRVKKASIPSSIYRIADTARFEAVIERANQASLQLQTTLSDYERTAQESLRHED